jgi:hypothetical protein
MHTGHAAGVGHGGESSNINYTFDFTVAEDAPNEYLPNERARTTTDMSPRTCDSGFWA